MDTIIFFAPSEHLKPYIVCYWHAIIDVGLQTHDIFPSGDHQIVFNLSHKPFKTEGFLEGSSEYAFLSGLCERKITLQLKENVELFGVHMKIEFLRSFLRCDLDEVVAKQIGLSHFFGRNIAFITEELSALNDPTQRVALIERFLLEKIALSKSPHYAMVSVLEHLSHQGNSLNNIAHDLRLSQRQTERIFKQHVGIAQKKFTNLKRFHTASRYIGMGANIHDVVYDLGYFDQSHFIRHFKKYTGLTPSAYQQHVAFVQYKNPQISYSY